MIGAPKRDIYLKKYISKLFLARDSENLFLCGNYQISKRYIKFKYMEIWLIYALVEGMEDAKGIIVYPLK